MSHRYAPLPNPTEDHLAQGEMDAAFDDDDDDDTHIPPPVAEAQPLNPSRTSRSLPGTYDFENVDYDYPPPGSPPAPSSFAITNNHGNSNGIVPSFSADPPSPPGLQPSWLRRTAASVLPQSWILRLHLAPRPPVGIVGSGVNNDGVFANVTAKPSRLVQEVEGDNMYLVPEESRSDAPPSYAHAQADAVPPYWETTVHAPFSADGVGDMIVDSLPTGTLFSFLWNMLISISFQFVGFLLTYLLHTTHAARLGSRAGLGVTLIQYGFALRSKTDAADWSWRSGDSTPESTPTMGSASEANEYYKSMHNGTSGFSDSQTTAIVATAATEWLSFFLMTMGWFILLTSLLSFWRIKRWERGIIASQRENAAPAASSTPQQANTIVFSHFGNMLGFPGASRSAFLRQGFGFGDSRSDSREREYERRDSTDPLDFAERAAMIPVGSNTPRNAEEAARIERQLQEDLRAAGLI